MWSDWYVIYNKGTGLRLLKKPSENDVHGSAGSMSNMIRAKPWSYEKESWTKHNENVLKMSFTLDEFKKFLHDKSRNPDQTVMEDFF